MAQTIEELVALGDTCTRSAGFIQMLPKSEAFSDPRPGDLEFFTPALQGAKMIDIGCGSPSSWIVALYLAARCGAREYVGVDKYWYAIKVENEVGIDRTIRHYKSNGSLPFQLRTTSVDISNITCSFQCADMLDYLSKQPDKSANVMMSGFDHVVINDDSYVDALVAQIARVVPDNGLAFGYHNTFLPLIAQHGFSAFTRKFCEADLPKFDWKGRSSLAPGAMAEFETYTNNVRRLRPVNYVPSTSPGQSRFGTGFDALVVMKKDISL